MLSDADANPRPAGLPALHLDVQLRIDADTDPAEVDRLLARLSLDLGRRLSARGGLTAPAGPPDSNVAPPPRG